MFNINFDLIFFRIKLLSAVLSLFFGGIAYYFIFHTQKLIGLKAQMAKLAIKTPEAAAGGALESKWEEILRHVDSARELEWKFAVIEADKLTDETLKQAGFSGDTMGDRLMAIDKSRLVSLDGLWEAHKIRNKLVHDTNYFLRHAEARRAVRLYEETLRELGVI